MRQIVQVCVMVRKIILVGAVVVIAACSRTEQKPEPRPEPKPQAPAAKTPPDAGSIAQPKAPGTKRGPSVETVDATTPIEGLTITLEADGTAGWKLTARNDTDDMLSLVWDESSFVTGDGKSWGRLVPGVTRMLDVEKSHPAAPLAPHSSVTELVIPQVMVAYNEPLFEYDARRELNSGRLYVVVQSAAGKKSWIGKIIESDASPRGWWCFAAKSIPKRFCQRDATECQRQENRLDGVRISSDSCLRQDSAWCFIARFKGIRIPVCFSDEAGCARARQESIDRGTSAPDTGCEEQW